MDLEMMIEHSLDELAIGDTLVIRRMRDGYQVGRLAAHVWQRAGESGGNRTSHIADLGKENHG